VVGVDVAQRRAARGRSDEPCLRVLVGDASGARSQLVVPLLRRRAPGPRARGCRLVEQLGGRATGPRGGGGAPPPPATRDARGAGMRVLVATRTRHVVAAVARLTGARLWLVSADARCVALVLLDSGVASGVLPAQV